ncbi:pseudouridine synthase, partial [Thermus scotoductus]|uniref:pseudouridine synthase n=1 Tax=Thermus scotoductus TaxID=37636 RepID=UPI0010007993
MNRIVRAAHMPGSYTTTRHVPHAQKTVYDLLPSIPGLHPIGRLDRDSQGLPILTHDRHLTLRLTHPRYGVSTVYRVWPKGGTLPEAVCQRLEKGWVLEAGPARPPPCKTATRGDLITLRQDTKRDGRRLHP